MNIQPAMLSQTLHPVTEDYRCTIVSNLSHFSHLAEEWERLMRDADEQSLFLAHGWLAAWLEHFPPERLWIALVRNGKGKLVGAAPMKISRSRSGITRRTLRQVQFIGSEPCVYDWMKVVTLPGENAGAIVTAVARELLNNAHLWDVVDLRYCQIQEQLEIFQRVLSAKAFRADVLPSMPMPYLKLPNTVEDYETKCKKKSFRKLVNNARNRLATDRPGENLHLEFPPPGEAANETLDEFYKRHVDYWSERGVRSDFVRFPSLPSFYKTIHALFGGMQGQPGRFRLSLLKLEEEVVSYHMGMWQGNGYLAHIASYNPEYDRYRPGVLHFESLIHHTIEHGGTVLEFGRGDEDYKYKWTQDEARLWNLMVYKNPWTYLLRNGDIWGRNALKRILSLVKKAPVRDNKNDVEAG